MTKEEHLLLHLQSMRRHLTVNCPTVVPEELKQVEFDMYEIGEHLGFSPKEVNNDAMTHI